MLHTHVFAHMDTLLKWFRVSELSFAHFLSLGISHPDYFLCWGDHQSETPLSNQEVGRR